MSLDPQLCCDPHVIVLQLWCFHFRCYSFIYTVQCKYACRIMEGFRGYLMILISFSERCRHTEGRHNRQVSLCPWLFGGFTACLWLVEEVVRVICADFQLCAFLQVLGLRKLGSRLHEEGEGENSAKGTGFIFLNMLYYDGIFQAALPSVYWFWLWHHFNEVTVTSTIS